jgi:hypothetical protein
MGWLVGRWWFWVLSIGALFAFPLVRVFVRPAPKLPPIVGTAPAFQLVRESGAPFGKRDLDGKVWVATRFDARDEAPVTRALDELRRRLKNLGDELTLVAVADREDAATLSAWAQKRQLNPKRWVLVTGAPEALRPVREALRIEPGRASTDPLVLVDGAGQLRGVYDVSAGTQKDAREAIDQLVYDAGLLVNRY